MQPHTEGLNIWRDNAIPQIKIETSPTTCCKLPRKPIPLSTTTSLGAGLLYIGCAGSQTTMSSSDQEANHPRNIWPQMARTWLIADSFTNFCPFFQFRTNQTKLNIHPKPVLYNDLLLVKSPTAFFVPTASSQGTAKAFPVSAGKFFHSSACLWISAKMQVMVVESSVVATLNK